ncbi:MAG: ABC transporter ATP-binding protein [Deltaproteobacteria bacterium]|nr:ABC transporter ATP-binding protein [Deltaproteobacteria bacterium]MBW1954647.1 ABC transporter ATP-binding protein [Deltaproteobacteria bacterium]MBW2040499.1 ABC transporter ATP-binding protein [Deltaproteobacteria bacterium]MBW2131367.1 ABC transporter ATP-binding protein [Deltaproteobacteria bacterium]
MSNALEINAISKQYNGKPVIQGMSLEIKKGEIGCLLGESGCGKTTVLRCVAGFEPIHTGWIRINGMRVSGPGICVSPENRQLGMVFQDYALFPHLTVEKNISFGLDRLSKIERDWRVKEMLGLMDLEGDAKKFPHEISGGQQQRVSLARALAPNPELLLLDEPFSNLDETLRERLCSDIRNILKKLGTSAVLVTHDQREAFAMGDIIGVMRQGGIEQWGSPYDLYHRPKTRYVADFVGEGVLLQGRVTAADEVNTGLGTLRGPLPFPYPKHRLVEVLIRPDDILYDANSPLKATILEKRFRGANILYVLRLQTGEKIQALFSSHHNPVVGQSIGIRPHLDEIILFEAAEK